MAKDYTKYNVEGIDGEFKKARLVQAILKHYVENNAMLWETILVTFPLELQGKKGVISKKSEVEKERDFYVDAPMALQDGTEIVTCRQWGKHNLVHFIERAKTLGYEISVVGGEDETQEEDTLKFTTEQINAIGKAWQFYDIEQVLGEVLGVETYQIPSLEKEPYLEELVEDRTFGGVETELSNGAIARAINKVYGNLCYLSQYDQEGKGDKTSVEYSNLWADLLKKLETKATNDDDYWSIGESSLEKLTPFEDKDEMEAFVHSAYNKAIDLDDDISSLTVMANRLNSEYYTNNELLEKAGKRALDLAETFKDYSSICFNDNEENLFSQAVFEQAFAKTLELKDQAEDGDLENLVLLLEDDDDNIDNIKKIDPNWVPTERLEIKISGRIPEYYFASVKEEYIEVFEKAIKQANENMDTMESFLQALLKTTLENKEEDMEIFKVDIDMEEMRKDCPKFVELLEMIKEDDMDHYALYDEILDTPYEPRVIFIEDDARISITKNWGEDEVLAEQKLIDFLGAEENLDLTEDKNEAIKNQVTALHEAQNHEFVFDGDVEDFTVFQSTKKTLTISNWVKPDDLTTDGFLEKEHDVVIIHDDIVDYTFDITTKNFDLAKITFLQFASADEVRNSVPELVANYLFYGDEHISPDKDRHRDKGIELQYKSQYAGLSALLEG
jgi:hypothetical protein|tara:strand:+ start:3392 stop:5410 length:2019 start_codon:yes stop_codon:yes gene_type:complete